MPIDNPQAIKFVNEQVRPMAERLRAIKAEIDGMMVDWFAGIDALVPNDPTPVADGREAEGVSRLTGADCVSLVVAAQAVQTALASYSAIVAKPCVRPLSAS
jgi:hypothetical protein